MRPSTVCFVVAGTVVILHEMLFEMFGGFDTIRHNPMTGEATLLSYALAAGAAFAGWRMRKGEQGNPITRYAKAA